MISWSAVLLFGASTVLTPTERFVSFVRAGDLARAAALVDGRTLIDGDINGHSKSLTPGQALEFSKGCELSSRRTKSHGDFYRLWWNCGTEIDQHGALARVTVVVDVLPTGAKVLLRNVERLLSYNEQNVKDDLRSSPEEAKESVTALAAAGTAGDVATLRNLSGGVAFTPGSDALLRISIDDVAAKLKGCFSHIQRQPTLAYGGEVTWACSAPLEGRKCYNIGYSVVTRGEGYWLNLGRWDIYDHRCGPLSPPMPPAVPLQKAS
ncbi:MAG: hypothetical protein JWL96_3404 [Sphingomonas bacterium]|uniref:hypothetical protein n=1 Tax=Sphingomonas bacterium TaxID=1895847 RepID=UPI00262EA1CE|nr:hypothetical protein [Sphingomonas bacterium]MDB5711334.1 hypothetical protein [Sphingomonas bacterium]